MFIRFMSLIFAVLLLSACNTVAVHRGSSGSISGMPHHYYLTQLAKKGDTTGFINHFNKNVNDIDATNLVLAIQAAVRQDDVQMVDAMLKANKFDATLYATYALGFVESQKMLNYLVSKGGAINGTKVNSKDIYAVYAKQGPLGQIGGKTKLKTVELLIDAGADPHREMYGGTGQTAITKLDTLIKAFSKHAILADQTQNMRDIKAYLKKGKPKPLLERLIYAGDLNAFKSKLSGRQLGYKNKKGQSLLHIAADANQLAIVKFLIKKHRTLVSKKDNQNQTPLDLVKTRKNRVAEYLSCYTNRYCKTVAAFKAKLNKACAAKSSIASCQQMVRRDVHGVFLTEAIKTKMVAIEYKNACEKFNYAKCRSFSVRYQDSDYAGRAKSALEAFSNKNANKLFNAACGNKGSKAKCKQFARNYKMLVAQDKIENALLFHSQKCRLKENGWFYKSSQCKSGFAHGQGEAVNNEKQLSYKGRFVNGQRVKGKVYYDSRPMFDGALSNGKPNGMGICFYNGDPEKCEFYEGKRVDAIYKQRLANAEQQRKMDEKLAEMKRLQEQQTKQINQIQTQVSNQQYRPPAQQSGGGSSVGKEVGDYVLKKAGEKVMDKLFDRLF